MKTVLAAAALLTSAALAPLAVTGPADAFQRNSVPIHVTIQVPPSFPKSGYYKTFTAHVTADNGRVPDTWRIRCWGTRAEGGYARPEVDGYIDATTGDAPIDFYTPATGHWSWACYTWSTYTWTIYRGVAFDVAFVVTEPTAG